MIFIRWIVFLPVLMFSTAVMQAIGGYAGEAGPWWIVMPLYMLIGWTATLYVTYQSAQICPNLKIGGWMFFGIFTVLEIFAFFSGFTDRPAAENIIRLGNDSSILMGVLYAALEQDRKKDVKQEH